MTTFYNFPDQSTFAALGGRGGDYTIEGVGYSVIGELYAPEPEVIPEDYEPVLLGFLVNTTEPIEAFYEYEVIPTSPMRIFG